MRHRLMWAFVAFALPISVSTPARANDLGCQVLLCRSSPGGATRYGACIVPMTKLWQRLATGGSFPGCSGGGVARTKVYDRDSATGRRVVMTFNDGRKQTYSLANIERLSEPTVPPAENAR